MAKVSSLCTPENSQPAHTEVIMSRRSSWRSIGESIQRYLMNNYFDKMVRRGAPLLAIFILFAAMRAKAVAQGFGGMKSGESSAERGDALLVLASLEVEPATPGPKTLCKLRVRIRNKGGQAATSFLFGVRINGQ